MKVKELIEKFKDVKVLVVGDIFLDSYIFGTSSRISAEAPVPIVLFEKEEERLGGAANVALNVKNLTADVSLAGFIGQDQNGMKITDMLHANKINYAGVVVSANFTITKERIMSNNHQITRIDFEKGAFRNINYSRLLQYIIQNSKDFELCIISDYNKGTVLNSVVESINSKIILADTKGNPEKYKGIRTITPNINELVNIATKYNVDVSQPIYLIARSLLSILSLESIIVTMGERGAMLITETEQIYQQAIANQVFDVSGAGDTFISAYSLAKYVGASNKQALAFSCISASFVVAEIGTTPINLERILQIYGDIELE